MNQTILFERFEILADPLNGVQKLRELILQLAVMGKLVPQDPSDEPASIFDNETNEENEQLAINGKTRKLQKISKEEVPYKLPDTWKWMRLSDISHDWGQKKPDVKFIYIDVTSINKELGLISEDLKVLNPEDAPSRARKIVKKGTVIYSTVRPYLLNIAIVDTDYDPEPIVSTAFAILHPYSGILNKYLYYYLRSKPFISYVESEMTGMAYPAINDTKLYKGLIPLPPLAEQKRIVSKVNELMTLCDKLEASRQKKQELQSNLNSAALDRMLSAENQKEFEQNWQLICENFDILYDNPENVEKLKQAILQLAVQGKLVEQNPEDEPASVLIEKIEMEKRKFVKERNIRKSQSIFQNGSKNEKETPCGWEKLVLGSCIELISGQHLGRDEQNDAELGLPYLTGPADFGPLYPTATRWTEKPKVLSRKGDILITVKGAGVGKTNILGLDEAAIGRQLMAIRPICLDDKFVYLLILASYNKFQELSIGLTVPGISREDILDFQFGLPPLEEQKRIVEKVDSLMNLCNQLVEKIGDSQKNVETLMDAFLIEAVRKFK